jgi:branched-chain amino acid transport system substrate-binding protein
MTRSSIRWAVPVCVVAAVSLGGCAGTPRSSATSTAVASPRGTTVAIGVDLAFGWNPEATGAVLAGARLAVEEVAGRVGDIEVAIPDAVVYDDAVNGMMDPATGVANIRELLAEPTVTNEAGLLQCGPTPTNPALTLPDWGALELRSARPDDLAFVRITARDDVQPIAAAKFVRRELDLSRVYVIDDGEEFGAGVADSFVATLEKEGGTVVRRDQISAGSSGYDEAIRAVEALNPEVVFFGGVTMTGAPEIAQAAHAAGLDVPLIGVDGIFDGDASLVGSFLNLAGDDAADAYSLLGDAGDGYPARDKMHEKFQEDAGWAVTGYTCAQVILDGLARAAPTVQPGDLAGLRAAVREAVVDPTHTYDTGLGTFSFDENGDRTVLDVSVYRADLELGDWKYLTSVDAAR